MFHMRQHYFYTIYTLFSVMLQWFQWRTIPLSPFLYFPLLHNTHTLFLLCFPSFMSAFFPLLFLPSYSKVPLPVRLVLWRQVTSIAHVTSPTQRRGQRVHFPLEGLVLLVIAIQCAFQKQWLRKTFFSFLRERARPCQKGDGSFQEVFFFFFF